MKSDNHNISEAYSKVNHDEIIEEVAPVNRLGQMARNLGGRALKAVGANETGNRMQGQWEVGAETNRLYNMFMRDLAAGGRDEATGQDISGWMQKTANFSAENPSLKKIDLKKSYPKNQIRPLFVNATKDQAAIFSGMSDTDSRFGAGGNDQQTFASAIAVLTIEQRIQFVTILLQQGIMTPEELLSTKPLTQAKAAAAAPAAPAAPATSADQEKKDVRNARRRQLGDEKRAHERAVELAAASAGVSQSVNVGSGSSAASTTLTGGTE